VAKVAVFGCGRQGSAVASILACLGHDVTCLDTTNDNVPYNCKYEHFRFTSTEISVVTTTEFDWSSGWDLIVNALPSKASVAVLWLALDAKINVVDVAFSLDDKSVFDEYAKNQGCTVIHDCGLAPGLPNLLIGKELHKAGGTLDYANVYVGGVAKDSGLPYGYKVTWSLDDLYEEYTRPGRYVENHEIRTVHPFYSPHQIIIIDGVALEAFVSDGLRSLLSYKDRIQHMREYTLRHIGHMDAVHRLIDKGGKNLLIDTLVEKCQEGTDVVYLKVDFPDVTYNLVVEGDHAQTAMTKTTAHSCAAFCSLLLEGIDDHMVAPGVWSCEAIGEAGVSRYILSWLKEHAGFEFNIERHKKVTT